MDQDKQTVDLHQLTAPIGTVESLVRGPSGNGRFAMATVKPHKGTRHTHATIEGPFSADLIDRALTAALAVLAGGAK